MANIDPGAWLRAKGFNPEGDLCKLVPSASRSANTTAMYDAAFEGELGVCHFIFERCGALSIRTQDSTGRTPLMAACSRDHLTVAKWLVKMGAAVELRDRDRKGDTLMHKACGAGHVRVARWLLAVGSAEDVCTRNRDGEAPIVAAAMSRAPGRLAMVKWLVLQGATKGEDGHVDRTALLNAMPQHAFQNDYAALCDAIEADCAEHAKFASAALSALACLRGHGGRLLILVAEFCGVVRGRQLRSAREAARILRTVREPDQEAPYYGN